MINIKSILCPVDFSEPSRRALEHSVVFARWFGAEFTVLHVVPSMPETPDAFLTTPAVVPLSAGDRRRLLTELAQFARPAEDAGLRLRLLVDEGFAVPRILANAQQLGAGLIVVGTRGEGGITRLVLGSVAEKIVRLAPCPVVTVPPRTPPASAGLLFRTILCPIDFSDETGTALSFALSLAREAKAHLILLHVLGSLPADDPRALLHFGSTEYRSFLEGDARERILALLPPGALEEVAPEVVIAAGKADREILDLARERDAGLVVMVTSALGPVEPVLREAPCPILTSRAALPVSTPREAVETVTE